MNSTVWAILAVPDSNGIFFNYEHIMNNVGRVDHAVQKLFILFNEFQKKHQPIFLHCL